MRCNVNVGTYSTTTLCTNWNHHQSSPSAHLSAYRIHQTASSSSISYDETAPKWRPYSHFPDHHFSKYPNDPLLRDIPSLRDLPPETMPPTKSPVDPHCRHRK